MAKFGIKGGGAPRGNKNAQGSHHVGHGRNDLAAAKALKERMGLIKHIPLNAVAGGLAGGLGVHALQTNDPLAGEVAAGALAVGVLNTLNISRLRKKINAKHGVTDAQVTDYVNRKYGNK